MSAAGAGPQLPEPDAGDTSADTEPEIEATPPLQIAGRWGMFYFEDPVAIDVQQDGSTLSGIGCCGGLEEDSDTSTYCCGELRGQVRGNQASFSFLLGLVGGSYDYEVIISSDATRMSGSATDAAGTLFQSSWLRLREGERLLSESGSWAMSTDPRNGGYTIKPTNPSAWFDFDGSYEFVFTASGMLLGDLGVFHETEFVDAEDTATFGPVPATQPSMPVQIVMQHDQRSIRSLAATMPDGEIVEFEVTSFRP